MARVPGDPEALQAAPVRPVYQDPNAANGAFDSGGKALVTGGAELQDASSKLAVIADRVQTRADTVARARDISAYHEAVTTEARRVSTEEDLSRPETVKNFAKFTADQMQNTLKNHAGSPVSKDTLVGSLEGIRSSQMDNVAGQSLVAQKSVVSNYMDKELNANVSGAIESPGTLSDRLSTWASRVKEMTPGLGTVEANKWQKHGDEEITRSVVRSFIDKGQYGEAERILKMPGVESVMSGEVQRSLNAKLTSGRAALYKAEHAGELKLQAAQQIMGPGYNFSVSERARLAGIAAPNSAQTASERIAGLEKVLDRALTPEEQLRALHLQPPDTSPFSDKDSAVMLDTFQKVGDGTATPHEVAAFQTAATNYTQPRVDPMTGQLTPGKILPAHFQDAVDGGKIKLSTVPGNGAGPSAQKPDTTQADPNVSLDIFNNAKNLAGMIPAGARALAGTPVIGGLMPSPQMVQMRADADLKQRSLATLLQDSPHLRGANNEAARKDIESRLDIVGGLTQPPENLQNHIVGVDRFLGDQLKQAQGIIARGPGGSSREEYLWAQRASDAIANFRFHLNAPPLVKASQFQAWAKDHAGQNFVGEDGKIYTAPSASAGGK